MPSRTSAHSWVCSPSAFGVARTRIIAMHTADTAKVSASSRNAHPVLATATTAAPTIGPITIIASGRIVWPIEFASTSCSSGTIIGMIELNAGPKIACPAP